MTFQAEKKAWCEQGIMIIGLLIEHNTENRRGR